MIALNKHFFAFVILTLQLVSLCIPQRARAESLERQLSAFVHVNLSEIITEFPLGTYTYIYEDRDQNLDHKAAFAKLQAGQFVKSDRKSILRGYQNLQYWFAIVIRNESSRTESIDIMDKYVPYELDAYMLNDGDQAWTIIPGGAKGGNQVAFQHQPLFRLLLQPGLNLVLFRQNTMVHNFVPYAYQLDASDQYFRSYSDLVSLFIGGFITLIFYNIFTAIILRDRERVFYCAYLVTGFLYNYPFISVSYGQYLPFGLGPDLYHRAIFICLGVSIALFGSQFLYLKRYAKRANTALMVTCCLLIACFCLGKEIFSLIHAFLGLVLCVILIFCAFVRYRRGFNPAFYYLISWGAFTSGAALTVVLNFYPSIFETQHSISFMAFGFYLEMILVSFASSEKIRLSISEQNTSLKQKSHALEESQRKGQHAFTQLEKVFYKHQIDQIRQGKQLEETMPTVVAESCVISFDIIGSSKIQHVKAKEFLHTVFSRCYGIMMEGYDGNTLKANAYRIKEMGDGFLCSVGYPFKSKSDNIANDALELAYCFKKVLDEEAEMLQPEEPVCCGIGIALDTIAGFYPETGTKEYDLYGRAIVLATRYEGMRKLIQMDNKPQSILIIQERVHASLDRDLRKRFMEINLKDSGLIVRDDMGATRIYYKILTNTIDLKQEYPSLCSAS